MYFELLGSDNTKLPIKVKAKKKTFYNSAKVHLSQLSQFFDDRNESENFCPSFTW